MWVSQCRSCLCPDPTKGTQNRTWTFCNEVCSSNVLRFCTDILWESSQSCQLSDHILMHSHYKRSEPRSTVLIQHIESPENLFHFQVAPWYNWRSFFFFLRCEISTCVFSSIFHWKILLKNWADWSSLSAWVPLTHYRRRRDNKIEKVMFICLSNVAHYFIVWLLLHVTACFGHHQLHF